MLVLALLAMLTQQSIGPDFAGKCQEAAAKKAGVQASAVKVKGKYKGQDGRYMIDFKLADGRAGVCRSKPDASVDEVKLEERAPAPAR
jgi:hypothetical protein